MSCKRFFCKSARSASRSGWLSNFGNVLLLSQLHVAILGALKSISCSFHRGGLLSIHKSLLSCLIFFFFFNFDKHQRATLFGVNSPTGSPFYICDTLLISLVDSSPPAGLTVLDNWVFGFGWVFTASKDLLVQVTHFSNSFLQFHPNNFRNTISWECL